MWLPRELFPSGVKQSWRAGKLSKNSFSPQSLAEQAFCVYLLASGQSSHTCARVRAAPLVCQEFCGILQHFCTFGAVWVIFIFFLRVTASSTASWCVSGRGGTQDRNCYLSVSFRNIHEEEITPNIFLLNQQIGIERTAFLAWFDICGFSFCKWMSSCIESLIYRIPWKIKKLLGSSYNYRLFHRTKSTIITHFEMFSSAILTKKKVSCCPESSSCNYFGLQVEIRFGCKDRCSHNTSMVSESYKSE